jgi:hypothetical protein
MAGSIMAHPEEGEVIEAPAPAEEIEGATGSA